MMRSGQYKMSGVGSRSTGTDVVVNQFRATQNEFGDTNSGSDYPHMNSLVLTMDKMAGNRRMRHGPIKSVNSKNTQNNITQCNESQYDPEDTNQMDDESSETSEILNKIANLPNSQKKILEKHLNKSSESLISPREAVTKVEQRVKSLLQRSDSSRHKLDEPEDHIEDPADAWQYGHLVTLPRRQRRSIVSSNYSLSDTASYISGSSGYSSSSSSSYGSFKSSSSAASTLIRKKSISESISESNCCRGGEESPPLQSQPYRNLIDNPMYDIRSTIPSHTYETPSTISDCDYPGSPSSLYSTVQENDNHVENIYDIPHNDIHEPTHCRRNISLKCLEESSLDMEGSDFDDAHSMDYLQDSTEDPVARECREYFERRLENSKDFKKRWSMCSSDSGAETAEHEESSQNITKPTVSEMIHRIENTSTGIINDHSYSNLHPSPTSQSPTSIDPCKKTPLDEKMDFLRKEIAGLMKQDNALFRQLLTLHESIEALKSPPQHPASPNSTSHLSWNDLEEEEEEDEEDETLKHLSVKNHLQDDTEDEGLEADRSLSFTPSPSSTLSSHASSTYDYSQKNGPLLQESCQSMSFNQKADDSSNSSWKNNHSRQSSLDSDGSFSEPLYSNCPTSVESTQLFSKNTQLTGDQENNEQNIQFRRCRKSYAPNARNRRRSSSAKQRLPHQHSRDSSADQHSLSSNHSGSSSNDIDQEMSNVRPRMSRSTSSPCPPQASSPTGVIVWSSMEKPTSSVSSTCRTSSPMRGLGSTLTVMSRGPYREALIM